MRTRLTNGATEAINGLVQSAKRLARGFRSLPPLMMSYLKAGKRQADLTPYRQLPTRWKQ